MREYSFVSWFTMWQSSIWNGKDTAMPLAILFAAFAAVLAENEREVKEAE